MTRFAFSGGLLIFALLVADGLATSNATGVRGAVSLTEVRAAPNREVQATVRIEPASAARDASWVSMTAWQGSGIHVDRMRRVSDGVYRTTAPFAVHGGWKSLVRIHKGRSMIGLPVFLPKDTAIPAPEVPATARFSREFVPEKEILQREAKDDVPGWLWNGANLLVLAFGIGFVSILAWGVGRLARRAPRNAPPTRNVPIGVTATPTSA